MARNLTTPAGDSAAASGSSGYNNAEVPAVAQTSDLFSDVPSDIRTTRMPLSNGAGQMSALGFGTLIPDAALTKTATRDAFDAGFRHFDCAERYRNEREVGEALEEIGRAHV